jgi:integrase
MTFHDLRHTFGTLAVRVFPLSDVQRMMGHADLSTTMKYVHYVPQHDAGR